MPCFCFSSSKGYLYKEFCHNLEKKFEDCLYCDLEVRSALMLLAQLHTCFSFRVSRSLLSFFFFFFRKYLVCFGSKFFVFRVVSWIFRGFRWNIRRGVVAQKGIFYLLRKYLFLIGEFLRNSWIVYCSTKFTKIFATEKYRIESL